MSAYFVAQINIFNEEAYSEYLARFDGVFAKYEGEVVAVDDGAVVLEGEWPYGRTVLIKFPDKAALLSWYKSDDYRDLARIRQDSSESNIVAIEGRE